MKNVKLRFQNEQVYFQNLILHLILPLYEPKPDIYTL